MKPFVKGLLCAVCISTIVAGTYSATVDETSVEGEVALNKISIELSETMIGPNGTEIAYTPPDVICPGESVSNIKRITSSGADCWIRLVLENDGELNITEDFFNNFESDKWIKKSLPEGVTHFYYKEKLSSDDGALTIFEGISLPATWGNEHSGKKISYSLNIEAIQADNFNPDLESDEPWGGTSVSAYQLTP